MKATSLLAPGSLHPLPPSPPWPWRPPKLPGWIWMKPSSPVWPGVAPARPAARSRPVSSSGKWARGELDSYAFSIAPPDHWHLVDCIAIVSGEPKPIGSTEGHALAGYQSAAGQPAWRMPPRRLEVCRKAILKRDFAAFAEIVELDSNLLHAVMMTSSPALFYWQPATLTVMQAVRAARAKGLPACYTSTPAQTYTSSPKQLTPKRLPVYYAACPGVHEVRTATVGGPAGLFSGTNQFNSLLHYPLPSSFSYTLLIFRC